MPLPRSIKLESVGEQVHIVDVWDIRTKTVVFTGSIKGAATFLGIPYAHARRTLEIKSRFKKTICNQERKNKARQLNRAFIPSDIYFLQLIFLNERPFPST